MGEAIGQILPTALGVAVSPLPSVAVVLMLVTPRGRVNGPAFVIGWLIGLAIVGAIVLAVIMPVLLLVIGVKLIGDAITGFSA